MCAIAKVLRRRMGAAAKKVPTRELPNWLIRIAVPYLGVIMNATSEKAQRLLGWTPRSSEEAIVATAESLIRLGLV
jgi:dihydroflavonol-4-reductase